MDDQSILVDQPYLKTVRMIFSIDWTITENPDTTHAEDALASLRNYSEHIKTKLKDAGVVVRERDHV